MRYLRLTRGQPGRVDARGLEPLRLALWDNGKEVAKLVAYSGAPGHQVFRTLAKEVAGQLEPIPEGTYRELGAVDWAGGAGNWVQQHPEVESPIWITIYPRRAIGFHLDGNRSYAPGSAGCVVVATMDDLRVLANWWHDGPPAYLEVDWGLGTIGRAPVVKQDRKTVRVRVWAHPRAHRISVPSGLEGDYEVVAVGGEAGGAAYLELKPK